MPRLRACGLNEGWAAIDAITPRLGRVIIVICRTSIHRSLLPVALMRLTYLLTLCRTVASHHLQNDKNICMNNQSKGISYTKCKCKISLYCSSQHWERIFFFGYTLLLPVHDI